MKRILLTGASGFIGYHVARRLLQSAYRIIAPVRRQSLSKKSIIELKRQGIRIIEGSFYDENLLNGINEPINAIIHLAAIRGQQDYPDAYYQKVNVEGTEHLLDFALKRQIPRFLFCSSVGVHGTIPRNQPASAQAALNPDNTYHHSKKQAEELVRTAQNAGLNTLILRPTVTYGLMDDGFIPHLIHLVKNKRFPLINSPLQIHLLSVHALAELFDRILSLNQLNGKAYIVADREPVLLQDIVKMIFDRAQSKQSSSYLHLPQIIFRTGEAVLRLLPNKKWLTSLKLISNSWTYDINETILDLGYEPRDTMQEIFPVVDNNL